MAIVGGGDQALVVAAAFDEAGASAGAEQSASSLFPRRHRTVAVGLDGEFRRRRPGTLIGELPRSAPELRGRGITGIERPWRWRRRLRLTRLDHELGSSRK
jgi:hypothetical protein